MILLVPMSCGGPEINVGAEIGKKYNATAARKIALAWVLAQGE